MDGELQHMFHEHPLILKAGSRKSNDDIDHSDLEISCEGCLTPILGPFYSCVQCPYFLHKVCAELPNELEHPDHQQHPLCLLSKPPAYYRYCSCDLCYKTCEGFVYHCSLCKFDVDTMCAATSHTITDKCHMHPLIPIQIPTSFFCHICIRKEEGVSYKCTVCPFWVHQNCIVLLPDTVEHSDHRHLLTLLLSVPLKYRSYSKKCDICYDELFPFQCSYYCEGCKFFAHIQCGRSETSSSLSRDQDDGQSSVFLPMKQDSTDSISRFVRKYIDGDANIDDKINLSDHEHPLFLIDEETTGNKTCEACAIRISAPSYGCVECEYFLHKCCTDLPKKIQDHPLHPQHQLTLHSVPVFFMCRCCYQSGNSFSYKCSECENFYMDIKCAAILLQGGVIYYETHKHPLPIQRINSSSTCTACGLKSDKLSYLKCDTCSFVLCIVCAMAPAVIEHRYGGKSKEPFILTYSPPENHYFDEDLCEICLTRLNPKKWFYHCLFGDQFSHVLCMVKCGADSNIKYGKSQMLKGAHEEHEVTTISCKYDCSPCSKCRHPMRIALSGGGVGFECKTCNFRRHLICPRS